MLCQRRWMDYPLSLPRVYERSHILSQALPTGLKIYYTNFKSLMVMPQKICLDYFLCVLSYFQSPNPFHFRRQQREITGAPFKINWYRFGIVNAILPPLFVNIIRISYHLLHDLCISLTIPFLECFKLFPVAFGMKISDVIMTSVCYQ